MRTVVWNNLQGRGSDYCELTRTPEGWLLRGTAIASLSPNPPLLCEYEVTCDEGWLTRLAEVRCRVGSETRSLHLERRQDGTWRRDTWDLPQLQGLQDVDLGITPATNTLPIRRLQLAEGESATVTAAWVRFPDLTIQPLIQTYTRVGADRYRYESATGFSTTMIVDREALVELYPGGWERVAVL